MAKSNPKPAPALKPAAPKPAAADGGKPAGEKKPRNSGSKAFPAEAKITMLAEKNPKRPSSKAYQRFELYAKAKTVKDFIAAGGTYGDLRFDSEKGFIKIG